MIYFLYQNKGVSLRGNFAIIKTLFIMSNSKAIFATTINELGANGVIASECHNFGITWGCRYNCPAFEKGNCKDVFFENILSFTKDGEYNEDELLDVLIKYQDKLSNLEINQAISALYI